MKKSYLVVTALSVALLGGMTMNPTAAFSAGWNGPGMGGPGTCQKTGQPGPRQQAMAEILGLTAEQQTQIQAIRTEHRQAVAALQQSMRTQRDALRQATQAADFDEAKVRNLAASQAETRTELIVARAKMQHSIQAILTPEQRELAKKLQLFARGGKGHRGQGPGFAGL